MKPLFMISIACVLLLSGCINHITHQGNMIDDDSVWIIQEGDTRFAIEAELGSPMIKDSAHPERSLYVEDYVNQETGKTYTRSITVIYDTAWRAQKIERSGFE